MTITMPKCTFCKNLINDEEDEVKCTAFPNGIPDEVLWEDVNKECNNGIKFEEE